MTMRGTLFNYLEPDDPFDAEFVRRTLDAVARLPAEPAPTFAFAHVLSPHWPFVFDRTNCRRPPSEPSACGTGGPRTWARFSVSMGWCTVTSDPAQLDVPPVILLQGDHGSAILRYGDCRAPEKQVEARPAWGALRRVRHLLPAGERAPAMGDSITVVRDVLGGVLRVLRCGVAGESVGFRCRSRPLPFHFLRVDPAGLRTGRVECGAQ